MIRTYLFKENRIVSISKRNLGNPGFLYGFILLISILSTYQLILFVFDSTDPVIRYMVRYGFGIGNSFIVILLFLFFWNAILSQFTLVIYNMEKKDLEVIDLNGYQKFQNVDTLYIAKKEENNYISILVQTEESYSYLTLKANRHYREKIVVFLSTFFELELKGITRNYLEEEITHSIVELPFDQDNFTLEKKVLPVELDLQDKDHEFFDIDQHEIRKQFLRFTVFVLLSFIGSIIILIDNESTNRSLSGLNEFASILVIILLIFALVFIILFASLGYIYSHRDIYCKYNSKTHEIIAKPIGKEISIKLLK